MTLQDDRVAELRPNFHFTAERNWINDPNGLIWHAGEYHLFFQHNPFGNAWGHMSWGHAVSHDLIRWTELPVAIAEDGDEAVFSGSVVFDARNSSGLGSGTKPPLIAMYTSALPGPRQHQSIAYSTDSGRTWQRYAGNPVLDEAMADFRDPNVKWDAARARWCMTLARSADQRVGIYTSDDLLHWTHQSDFGPAGAVDGLWECPDLFPLPVDGDPDDVRWVLVVSINPGGLHGGSGTQYFIGDFDGSRFIADDEAAVRWLDFGTDNYAGITFNDAPDSRRVLMAWMNAWQNARQAQPTTWNGSMTVPRTLELITADNGLELVSQPVVELESLRGDVVANVVGANCAQGLLLVHSDAAPLDLDAELQLRGPLTLAFEVDGRVVASLSLDPAAGVLRVERLDSGLEPLHLEAAIPITSPLRLRILLDHGSLEVFTPTRSITARIAPAAGQLGIMAHGDATVVRSQAHRMHAYRSSR